MTALYFDVLRPGDRVAVKPHASPVYHAIQYLLGRQTQDKLARFPGARRRAGLSVAHQGRRWRRLLDRLGRLGAAMTLFASLTQDLLHERRLLPADQPKGRMVALVGDAELDEGNVFEALLEGWKHDIRNVWWVIDYNRQSLDRVVPERLFAKIEDFFGAVGWQVVTLKYGKLLQAAFAQPDGAALRQWIDDCPNDLYSALTFKGGAGWRQRLEHDLGLPGIRTLLAEHDDDALAQLMTNLGGHDLDLVREAFQAVGDDDRPHCFIAYTIKGFRLPFAGHKDNHAGPHDARADGRIQEAAPGRGRAGVGPLRRPRPRCRTSWQPFFGRYPLPPAPRSMTAPPSRCRVARPARATRLDPGGVRPDHGRAGARRGRARGAHHHHLARRHGVDQPRPLGQPA